MGDVDLLAIREVELSELPTCAAVLRRAFRTSAEELGLTQENCPTNAAFITVERLERERHRGHLQFGAYLGAAQVGFFALRSQDGLTWELEKLAVLPEHRRTGIGSLLIDRAAEVAAARGGTSLHIGIVEESSRLKAWYADRGFVHQGTRVYEHLPFTVGYMELALPA